LQLPLRGPMPGPRWNRRHADCDSRQTGTPQNHVWTLRAYRKDCTDIWSDQRSVCWWLRSRCCPPAAVPHCHNTAARITIIEANLGSQSPTAQYYVPSLGRATYPPYG